MKSQVYKIRNLKVNPEDSVRTVRLKPTTSLFCLILAGILMMFAGSSFMAVGLVVLLVGLFGLAMLPDRVLIQFYQDYLILYNQKDRDSCTVVYYSEVVQWRYEYGRAWDHLTFFLTDGSTQSIEMFSRIACARYLLVYLPGKEIKSVRLKEGK